MLFKLQMGITNYLKHRNAKHKRTRLCNRAAHKYENNILTHENKQNMQHVQTILQQILENDIALRMFPLLL
jgi:hypothetical protein